MTALILNCKLKQQEVSFVWGCINMWLEVKVEGIGK